MNLASRKMALLEQKLLQQQEREQLDVAFYPSYDRDLQIRVSDYMSRIRMIY